MAYSNYNTIYHNLVYDYIYGIQITGVGNKAEYNNVSFNNVFTDTHIDDRIDWRTATSINQEGNFFVDNNFTNDRDGVNIFDCNYT